MTEAKLRLTAADGLSLHVRTFAPPSPRAVVQIVHGMAEHSGRYVELAERLTAAGYAVIAGDLRGHGLSVREGEEPGHLADGDGWNRAVEDVHRINVHAAREYPDLPRVVFGHSMGSFLVQQLMFAHPEDASAVILSASNGKPPAIALAGRGIARIERLRLGKRGKSKLLHQLSFKEYNDRFRPTRTDFDWLSRDDREVDAYIADPLCGFMVTTQTWVDLLDALPRLTLPQNLARIRKDLPIYLFAGDHDPVGDMGRGVARLLDAYRATWLTDVELRLYEGGRHEMLHETNRHQVMDDIVAWIDDALARLPSQRAA